MVLFRDPEINMRSDELLEENFWMKHVGICHIEPNHTPAGTHAVLKWKRERPKALFFHTSFLQSEQLFHSLYFLSIS
jgi:cbb3-type cytochrome oxidase subunit 1